MDVHGSGGEKGDFVKVNSKQRERRECERERVEREECFLARKKVGKKQIR